MKFKLPKIEYLLLAGAFILSALIRLYINFSTEYIPGAVGAYYIVQVKSVIENGSIAFKEFPLIFYLEAGLAKLILLVSSKDIVSAVDVAVRIFDAVIPVLSIIPAFLLVKNILGNTKNKTAIILTASFSIFYISFFTLVSDYQKNSFGLLWLFFLILFAFKSLNEGGRKNLLFASLFFVLTAVTHFGCFVIAILFLIVLIAVKLFSERKKLILLISLFAGIIVTALLVLLIFSPSRFGLLEQISGEIFHGPVLFALLKGYKVLSPGDILNVVFLNGMCFVGLIWYLRNRGNIENGLKVFILSVVITCFIISSLFLWSEWAVRFYYIAYIFMIPIFAVLFKFLKSPKLKTKLYGSLILIMLLSAVTTFIKKPVSNMDDSTYKELKLIKSVLPVRGTTMIVARLGMHYWAGLILDTYVGQQSDVRKEWWGRINHIYYLIQKKDIKPFGPAGLYGPPFPEPERPKDSYLMFDGNIFQLYSITKPPDNIPD